MRLVLPGLVAVLLAQASARADWPEFRGPRANGHAGRPGDAKPLGLPLRWSETANVKWKTPIPHRGWSTPALLGGRVWLTTATRNGHDFFAICLDAATGQIRFNEKVFHADNPEPLGNNVNCYASPSPVAEPGRVYVHFGSYGTACLNSATGKAVWERRDLPCRHYRGPGSSPILFDDLLVVSGREAEVAPRRRPAAEPVHVLGDERQQLVAAAFAHASVLTVQERTSSRICLGRLGKSAGGVRASAGTAATSALGTALALYGAGSAGWGVGRLLGKTPTLTDPNVTYDQVYQDILENMLNKYRKKKKYGQ